jgi:hypothetical protein
LPDIGAQWSGPGGGTRLAPDVVDQPLGRDELASVHEEEGQNEPLARPAESEVHAVAQHGEGSQDPELQGLVSHHAPEIVSVSGRLPPTP